MVNRMSNILPKIVSHNQQAFVPGRHIQDNLFVAYEAFHFLNFKKRGRKYNLALKVDMNKAYDRLEWSFIEEVLLKLGFCSQWVERIMQCLSSVKYSILLSGKKDSFWSERGLRQGDPLSPYLFIIVSYVLSNLVNRAAEEGSLKGIKMARHCPFLTHSFFADDALFFVKGDVNNCLKLKDNLDSYCCASGQFINLEKSCIFFSRNTPEGVKDRLCSILEVTIADHPGKYLGLLFYGEGLSVRPLLSLKKGFKGRFKVGNSVC